MKCILGLIRPNRGAIRLFGKKPGSPGCEIPGSGVGYMPQDLGLCSIFTINEIITYFGKIYSMNEYEIKTRTQEIKILLNIPENNNLIGKILFNLEN